MDKFKSSLSEYDRSPEMIPSKVSVLISIYSKNTREEVARCFDSLLKQTYKPDEVVVVIDGNIPAELRNELDRYSNVLDLKIKELPENKGLGYALNAGLASCYCEYVARIDIDDACMPHRLKLQKFYLDNNPSTIVLGGQVNLFNSRGAFGVRKVPISYQKILLFSLFRNPLNHSTVMFRKNEILKVGGYPPERLAQDYLLWISCLHKGYVIENLDETLAEMFVDRTLYARRGLVSLIYDLKPYLKNYKLKRNGLFQFCIISLARILYSLASTIRSKI
jgi:amylovoran biosynthesis glycosyltransferase AmsE